MGLSTAKLPKYSSFSMPSPFILTLEQSHLIPQLHHITCFVLNFLLSHTLPNLDTSCWSYSLESATKILPFYYRLKDNVIISKLHTNFNICFAVSYFKVGTGTGGLHYIYNSNPLLQTWKVNFYKTSQYIKFSHILEQISLGQNVKDLCIFGSSEHIQTVKYIRQVSLDYCNFPIWQ